MDKEIAMSTAKALERYTYADYASWPDDTRWELIDGFPYAMTPAPRARHQALVTRLAAIFSNVLKDSPCMPFVSPFDVMLDAPEFGKDFAENVVQPDLLVICDREKIKPHGCEGAPDLVVEILSPSSHTRDYIDKLRLYERFGVKEYWIIDPDGLRLHVLRPDEEKRFKVVSSLSPEDGVEAEAVEGLAFALDEVFADLP
jgi:Uma2 family endonuclease